MRFGIRLIRVAEGQAQKVLREVCAIGIAETSDAVIVSCRRLWEAKATKAVRCISSRTSRNAEVTVKWLSWIFPIDYSKLPVTP